MDMRQYEVFLAAVERGSLTRAAEETGYTQGGVSHIVKGMEEEFGFPILQRHRRGVSPTPEAERLIPALRELLRWNEQLEQEAASIRGIQKGSLRIGTIISLSAEILPRVLKRFWAQYPGITVRIREGGDHEVLEWLHEGQIDLALCCDQNQRSYDWIPLVQDSLLALLPPDYPAPESGVFPIKDFDGAPFIMLPMEYHRETQRVLDRYGVKPSCTFFSDDDYTTVAMVELGLGSTILSRRIVESYRHRRVQALELSPRCPRELGVALRSLGEISPAVRAFIGCAKAYVANEET